jgi:copper chaperone CopZ
MKIEGVKISWFPGRVKLRVDDLIGEDDLAHRVQADIAQIAGIKSIEVNPDNGVVLIRYERKTVTQPESVEALYTALTQHFPRIDFTKIRDWLESR